VKYWVRSYAESKKKKIRECNYHPEVHHLMPDGVTFGNMAPCTPQKVNSMVVDQAHKFVWYQDTINVFQLKIYGPFDFEKGYHIPKEAWKALEAAAEEQRIYVGGLNRKVPLGQPDRQDKDKKGRVGESHLAIRRNLFDYSYDGEVEA
jgi:hypothetical protein